MINNWEYGKQFVGEVIDSIDEWSDDKEVGLSIMDEWADYIWEFKNGKIYFIDTYYACYGFNDEVADKREAEGTLTMWFDSFVDLFKWILNEGYDGKFNDKMKTFYDYMKERIA